MRVTTLIRDKHIKPSGITYTCQCAKPVSIKDTDPAFLEWHKADQKYWCPVCWKEREAKKK